MAGCRFRAFAFVFLIPLLHADVTLRFKTSMTMNPALPAQMAGAMNGTQSALPQEMVLQLKGGKGFSTAGGYNTITDFTTQEMTLLDAVNSQYAKLKADQFGEALAGTMPKMPDSASAVIASMKTDISPARVTGRTAVIQGVETEEREIVFSITGPAIPNMPAGAMARVVMQLWSAKPGEVPRVPAIRELTGYSLWTLATMNPTLGLESMMKQLPGFSDLSAALMKEVANGAILRTHVDMFMPAMAAMLKQMPAGANPLGASFDPDAPFMQMNQEAVELSSAPVADSVFRIPEGYQEAAAADLMKGVLARSQAAAKQ